MDILCIGPHYEFRLKAFEDMAAPYNIPVIVIPEEIYSMLDGSQLNICTVQMRELHGAIFQFPIP